MAVSTMKQMKLGREIVKDLKAKGKPRNKKQLLLEVGYAESVATHKPGEIFNQEGTQNALAVALEQEGFTEKQADKVVSEIMNSKVYEAKDRLKAADLVYKRKGSYAAEKSINLDVNPEELRELMLKDMARFRGETS